MKASFGLLSSWFWFLNVGTIVASSESLQCLFSGFTSFRWPFVSAAQPERFWPNGYYGKATKRSRVRAIGGSGHPDSWCAIGLVMPEGTKLKFRFYVGQELSVRIFEDLCNLPAMLCAACVANANSWSKEIIGQKWELATGKPWDQLQSRYGYHLTRTLRNSYFCSSFWCVHFVPQ